MKQITKFFAIFMMLVSCLTYTAERTNEQGQVAAMSANTPAHPGDAEEEIIHPYSLFEQNPISF